MPKELVFKVTAKDCRWEYYRGSGKGGQNRNKTDSAARCTHVPSGAVGQAEDERSQHQNKKLAFERMARTDKFQKWCHAEVSRRSGQEVLAREKVQRELLMNTVVEVQGEDGKWTADPDLQIKPSDLAYLDQE